MSGQVKTQNPNLIGLLLVIFAAAVILIFFQSRGDDLGRLPKFLSDFSSGSFASSEGFAASIGGLIIAILIWSAWFGLGITFEKLLGRVDTEDFSALNFASRCAFGAAIWSLVWFFLGAVGAYSTAASVAVTVVGLVLAVPSGMKLIRHSTARTKEEKTDLSGKVSFAVLMALFIIGVISALAPPTAKDTLLYHLAVPKVFVAQGNFNPIEGNIASFLALGAEMHSVWAMLLGNIFSTRIGEAAATATVFGFAPLLILVTYGWARELGIEKSWSFLAALLVASVPTVFYVATNSYVDCALALFFTLAIYAFTKFWTSLETRWLVYLAIAIGAALSIKLTTMFLVAALALLFLIRARGAASANGNSTAIVLKGAGALVAGGLIASPWYLKTWIKTGSPLFPFYLNLWKGEATGWDVERSTLFQLINSNYGGADKNIFDYLFTPIKISLFSQPELPKFYDGVLGVAFLVGLPLLVWALWRVGLRVEIKVAHGVCGIVFLFWLFSSQQLRYLIPILPSLAVSIVAASAAVNKDGSSRKLAYVSFLGCAIAGMLVSFSWFLEKNPMRVVFGGETREDYLSRRLDYYKYYQTINSENAPETKVWLINMRRDSYHLAKPYFSDYMFEDWTLKKMVEETKTLDDSRNKISALGITHILARHDFLLDYKQSVIVDDERTESVNREKLQMTRDLILDKANTILSDGRFSLVKIK